MGYPPDCKLAAVLNFMLFLNIVIQWCVFTLLLWNVAARFCNKSAKSTVFNKISDKLPFLDAIAHIRYHYTLELFYEGKMEICYMPNSQVSDYVAKRNEITWLSNLYNWKVDHECTGSWQSHHQTAWDASSAEQAGCQVAVPNTEGSGWERKNLSSCRA